MIGPRPKCLVPFCERDAKAWGLCMTHKSHVDRLIKAGKATRESLEAAGKIRPIKAPYRTRSAKAWFLEHERPAPSPEETEVADEAMKLLRKYRRRIKP